MASKDINIQITPPNFQRLQLHIRGTSPYVQNRFSQKAQTQIRETQMAGATAKSKKVRVARDFDADFRNAQHFSTEGWNGIPAASFRNAIIAACRTVNFKMTHAKMACWVVADGFDADGVPLVRFTEGEPQKHEAHVRNQTGVVDLRARPMWMPGWGAIVTLEFDADMLTVADVTNLLARAGGQVGIGEGRPFSPNSNGMGWGLFSIVNN